MDYGSGDLLEVVCGAWNFEAGAVVAFAPVGAQLNPEGKPMEIEGSSGRGCGLTRDDLLRLRARVGRRPHRDPRPRPAGGGRTRRRGSWLEAVLPLSDVILDVTITPNRPDVMSILGIARELGAYYELPVRQPDTRVDDTGPETAAAVEVEDPLGCPRFVARQVSGITVGPSPLPAQLRLRAAGVRPISNVVGAGNYVMIEMGHPIHTFDLARIAEGRLNIRRALEGEQLRTLDGVDRRLLRDDIVVADPSGAVALAGVMGGESTEVSETTREVLVEAANWDPASVLATAPDSVSAPRLRPGSSGAWTPICRGRPPPRRRPRSRHWAAATSTKRCRRLPDPDRAATRRAPLGRGGALARPGLEAQPSPVC